MAALALAARTGPSPPSRSLLAVLPLLLAGCAASRPEPNAPEPHRARPPIERMVDELVATAELRDDVRAMIVYVHRIRPRGGARPSTAQLLRGASPWPRDREVLAAELEQEVLLALASRFRVVDPMLVDADPPRLAEASAGEAAEVHGATHLVVGDYVEKEGEIVLSVRLVDARSRLILAAARASLPFDLFGEHVRPALEGREGLLAVAAEPGRAFSPALAASGGQPGLAHPYGGTASEGLGVGGNVRAEEPAAAADPPPPDAAGEAELARSTAPPSAEEPPAAGGDPGRSGEPTPSARRADPPSAGLGPAAHRLRAMGRRLSGRADGR